MGFDTKEFRKRLRQALAADERSQSEIAAAAKVPRDQLSRWKGGRGKQVLPSVDSLARVVEELGVSAHWLLTGDGPMNPPDGADTLRLEVIGRVVNGDIDDETVRALATRSAEGDPIEDASETDPDGGEGGLGEEGPPAA